MSALSEALIASVGVLTSIGIACKFVWREISKKFDKQDVRFRNIEKQLLLCQERENRMSEERVGFLLVIDLLVSELRRVRPKSAVLMQARRLLDSMKIAEADKLLTDSENKPAA